MWALVLALALSRTVNLSWVQSGSPDLFYNGVYRSYTAGGPYTEIYESNVPITAWVDNTVENGQTYCYVVTAINAQGESEYSNEICKTIPPKAIKASGY